MLLFIEQSLSSNLSNTHKLSICKHSLKLLQYLLDLVNNDDEIESNVV